jgi:hypothetical protein
MSESGLMFDRGSEVVPALVVACEDGVGITIVHKHDHKRFLLCFDLRNVPQSQSSLVVTHVRKCIKSKYIDSFDLSLWCERNVSCAILGDNPTQKDCVFSK